MRTLAEEMEERRHRCGLNLPFDITSRKWSLEIITAMMRLSNIENEMDTFAYSDIQSIVSEISPKMLSARLTDLIEFGVIRKILNPQSPKKVRYQLTEGGRHFVTILIAMRNWGKKFGTELSPRCKSDRCRHALEFQLVESSLEDVTE